jgi:NADP-dependent 3-hydroxy acid dehydrogenase YdfG
MKNNFEEKLVLITGGSSGIGFALAEVLVKMGSNVFIVARREDDLKRVVSELNTLKGIARGAYIITP